MNLEARKIEFVQEFLKLQSEEVVSCLEKLLKKASEEFLEPITEDELNKRIDQSESDFLNNKFKSSAALLDKYS